jgi:hypothetical protein
MRENGFIKINSSETYFQISPNPASSNFTVELKNDLKKTDITITDMEGTLTVTNKRKK